MADRRDHSTFVEHVGTWIVDVVAPSDQRRVA